MPVKVTGNIGKKGIKRTIGEGTAKTFYLDADDKARNAVLSCEKTDDGSMALHLIVNGLWVHRNGLPMGEHELRYGDHFLKDGEEKVIRNSDEIKITNPNNIDNSIKASFMPAGSKK